MSTEHFAPLARSIVVPAFALSSLVVAPFVACGPPPDAISATGTASSSASSASNADAVPSTCPTPFDADALRAFLRRHAAAFGDVDRVAASLPLSFGGVLGERGRWQMVLDRTRSRIVDESSIRNEEGFDGESFWYDAISGVVTHLRDGESTGAAAEEWIARRRYLVDAPKTSACIEQEGVARVGLTFASTALGDPFLGFDFQTTALLGVTRKTADGTPVARRILAWSDPMAGGVRWPTSFVESRGDDLSAVTLRDIVSGYRCIEAGATAPTSGEACVMPPRSSFSIRWPQSGRVTTKMHFAMGQIFVRARAGGRDVWALLDSGASLTLIDSTTLLAKSFTPSATQSAVGATQAVTLGVGEIAHLDLGDLPLDHVPVASVPIPALDDTGEKRPELVFGFSIFQSAAVRIDYQHEEVTFAKDGPAIVGPMALAVPMVDVGLRLVVAGTADDRPVRFAVDTGNGNAFDVDAQWARENGLIDGRPRALVHGAFGAGNGETEQIMTRLRKASVGPIDATDVITHVNAPPRSGDVAGLLGNEAFARCPAITIDHARRTLWVEGPCHRLVAEDHAGIHLVKRDPAGSLANDPRLQGRPWVIGAMIPGSAAERAGLRIGDRLLTVANKPATLDLEAIRKEVERPAGTKVEIGYFRDGKALTTTLTLAEYLR